MARAYQRLLESGMTNAEARRSSHANNFPAAHSQSLSPTPSALLRGMHMLVLIDNYDSFTYNLVQYFGRLGIAPAVYRNDKITVEALEALF